MTKAELIQAAYDGYTEKDRGHSFDHLPTKVMMAGCFESLCEVMTAELLNAGGEISLPGLGKLKTVRQGGRKGRNPRTGQEINVPASNKVKFVAGKEFKEALRG